MHTSMKNLTSDTDSGAPPRPLEGSLPYCGESSTISRPSTVHNAFQSTLDICDSQASSSSLPSLHRDSDLEPPISESITPLHDPVPDRSIPRQISRRSSPYYRSPLQRSARKVNKDTQGVLTLNSDLTATAESVQLLLLTWLGQALITRPYSPAVKPYACGHRLCWPAGVSESSACFSTSRELNDHSKTKHADDVLGGGKPFRCSLEGCAKSWKSINGLQYHLQVFVRALLFE